MLMSYGQNSVQVLCLIKHSVELDLDSCRYREPGAIRNSWLTEQGSNVLHKQQSGSKVEAATADNPQTY